MWELPYPSILNNNISVHPHQPRPPATSQLFDKTTLKMLLGIWNSSQLGTLAHGQRGAGDSARTLGTTPSWCYGSGAALDA